MKKRKITWLLIFAVSLSMLSVFFGTTQNATCVKASASSKMSSSVVKKRVVALKKTYPEGTRWGDNKYYFWKAVNLKCYGCIAFAGKVSDKVFGKSRKVTRHKSFSKIKPGDHVRIGNWHSVIVLQKSGKTLTVVEGNFNRSVHWGRKITKPELKREGFYVETRY